ncbi:MAG: hypothetical protein H6742_15290 [Alphaproteobacteria bacterium]|nr:hypothetical protein [Alphaproteobacteria bacterium]
MLQARFKRNFSADELWSFEASGPSHAPVHTATLTLPDGRTFSGGPVHGNKGEAKKLAAVQAIAHLRS